MKKTDLLSSLKHCLDNKQDISEEKDNIILAGRRWPKTEVVRIPSSKAANQLTSEFSLQDVVCFIQNVEHADYYKTAQKEQVQVISRRDRRILLEFLRMKKSVQQNATKLTLKAEDCKAPQKIVKRSGYCDSATKSQSNLKRKFVQVTAEKEKTITVKRERRESPPQMEIIHQAEINHTEISESGEGELRFLRTRAVKNQHNIRFFSSLKEGCFNQNAKQLQQTPSNTMSLAQIGASTTANTVATQTAITGEDVIANIQADINLLKKTVFQDLLRFSEDDIQKLQDKNNNSTKLTRSGLEGTDNQQRCYFAKPHPVRGYELSKSDLSTVLNGCKDEANFLEERHRDALEACLEKGKENIKQSVTSLISKLRQLSESKNKNIDDACKSVIEKCISNNMEYFRDIFGTLLSIMDDGKSESVMVQEWLCTIESDFRKLLESLVSSFASMQTIPQTKTSLALFKFPAAVESLALDPGRVTYAVLQEVYFQLGVADFKKVVLDIISSVEKFKQDEFNACTNSNKTNILRFCQKPSIVGGQNSSSNFTNRYSNIPPKSPYVIDENLYSVFKASLADSLLNSYKKQIQDKIQTRD